MKNISEDCVHFDKTSDGRRFLHSEPTEAQIQCAQTLSPDALISWARGELDYGGELREEALVYLIQQLQQTDNVELASDLSAILNDRICLRTVNTYRHSLGESAACELAAELCPELWVKVLDPDSVQAAWLQICFWLVVRNLAKDYRKKQVRVSQLFPSLDSDLTTVKLVMELPSNALGLEDQIYLQEFLDGLSPREREAFVLRYAGDASIKDICNTMGRATSTVKRVLDHAKKQLAKAA